MNTNDIQAFRKRRLREAIDQFFDGRNVNLAKELRNKDGQPLKDGSYIGHLLKPLGESGSRPIDEDRVREIESLRPSLKGWFNQPETARFPSDSTSSKWPTASTSVYPSSGGISPFAPQMAQMDFRQRATTIPTLVPEIVPWDQLGVVLSKQYEGKESFDALAIPGQFGQNVQLMRWPDTSMYPDIQKGELVAVEPNLPPWPGDIVIAADKSSGATFGGRYVAKRGGGYFVKSKQPELYADADEKTSDILAVMVLKISGRSGSPPPTAQIRGL